MIRQLRARTILAVEEHVRLMRSLAVNPKFWCVLIFDVLFIAVSIYLSYSIRFEGLPSDRHLDQILSLLPLLLTVKIVSFYFFGLYRGMWRYTSTSDLINGLKATSISAAVIITVLLYLQRFEGLSRSVFILDTLFTFLLITGHRVAIRYFYRFFPGRSNNLIPAVPRKNLRRVLLIGAGDAAEKVIREVSDNPKLPYKIVGLVDDNPGKLGMKIHGIPVLGTIDDLVIYVPRANADELLIAISSISGTDMKRIVSICQNISIPFKALPGIGELIDGKVSVRDIREIDYKDLLGREEVTLDQEQIGSYLSDKVVLITGAGGSIGSELVRQVLPFAPRRLVLFDASEENLYKIQMELIYDHQIKNVTPVLGKVQDQSLLRKIFREYRPTVVFHAAAYKHVPLIENNPWQAVDNNIVGSQMVMEAAVVYGVERFVLVSTDKAVRPTNVMGASKRATEMLMHAYQASNRDTLVSEADTSVEREETSPHTIFMAVRFGNVLGSSGSVLPLFKSQIEKGGPVTVTHPEITRFFMSLDEAAQLIIQAGSMGTGGEIFILKMGEPVKIAQMAADIIRLSGKEPGEDIEIVYTGLREGEKLYEELITEGEGIVETFHDKIMVLRNTNGADLDDLTNHLENLCKAAKSYDKTMILQHLQSLLPEYTPEQNHVNDPQTKN